MPEVAEDGSLLVLQALAALLRTSPAAAAACETWLAPALLQLWTSRWREPLVADAMVDVFDALAAAPAALPPLAARLLPALVGALDLQHAAHAAQAATAAPARSAAVATVTRTTRGRRGRPAPPCAAAAATCRLRRWPPAAPLPPPLVAEMLPRLLRLLRAAADAETHRLGSAADRKIVSLAGGLPHADEEWSATLSAALRPSLSEAALQHSVTLVALALRHAPHLIRAHLQPLVGALVTRLRAARLFGLTQALLLLLARLALSAHVGAPLLTQTLLAIDPTPPPADGAASFVLRTWADSQGDVLKPAVAQPMLAGLIAIVGTLGAVGAPQLALLPVRGRRARAGRRRGAVAPLVVAAARRRWRLWRDAIGGARRAAVRHRPYDRRAGRQLRRDGAEGVGERCGGGGLRGGRRRGRGARRRRRAAAEWRARPSPFASADDYSVNLSDLLDDDDDDDDVSDDDESDDEGGDGEAVDLPAQMGGFVRALAAHVGEAGFAQLCAPLSEEERGAVGRLAAGAAA